MLSQIIKSFSGYIKCKCVSIYIYNSNTKELSCITPNRQSFPSKYPFLNVI